MKTLYILCGLPGSGKSTFVKACLNPICVISRDLIRVTLGISENVNDKQVGSFQQEKEITDYHNWLMKLAIESNQNCVLDNMNNKKYRPDLIKPFADAGYTIIGINFKTPLDVRKERRKNQISSTIMDNIYSNFHYIEKDEVDLLYNIQ